MQTYEEDIDKDKTITKKNKKAFKKLDLYKWLDTRKGMPFSSSWVDGNVNKLEKGFRVGIETGQLKAYPPLYDEENSIVAQFEHTIHVKDGSVEIFSLDNDY